MLNLNTYVKPTYTPQECNKDTRNLTILLNDPLITDSQAKYSLLKIKLITTSFFVYKLLKIAIKKKNSQKKQEIMYFPKVKLRNAQQSQSMLTLFYPINLGSYR